MQRKNGKTWKTKVLTRRKAPSLITVSSSILQICGLKSYKMCIRDRDYIEMCKTEITGSEEMQQDLAYMAGQWRDTVVQEIGRARYNELSEQLGCDPVSYTHLDVYKRQVSVRPWTGVTCNYSTKAKAGIVRRNMAGK